MMAEKRDSGRLGKQDFKMSMGKRSTKAAIAEKKRLKAKEVRAGDGEPPRGRRGKGASLLVLAAACVLAAGFAVAAEGVSVAPPRPAFVTPAGSVAGERADSTRQAFERAERAQERQEKTLEQVAPVHYDSTTNTVYRGDIPLGRGRPEGAVGKAPFTRDREPLDAEAYRIRYDDIEQRRLANQREYTTTVRDLENRMSGLNRDSDEYKRLHRDLVRAGEKQADRDRELGRNLMDLDTRRPGYRPPMLNR